MLLTSKEPGRDQAGGAGGAVDGVHVPPAVPLAEPEEFAIALEPRDLVDHVEPGLVRLRRHGPRPAGGRAGQDQGVVVLQAVHPLHQHRVRTGPLHERDVVLARVAGELEPGGGAAVGAHHPGGHGGVGGAGLRVLDRDGEGIGGVGVVDHEEGADAAHVEVPVGDPGAVGRPAEPVADAELLLVHPVAHPVDVQRIGAGGEPGDGAVGEPLDVDVALANERHAVALGENLAYIIVEAGAPAPPSLRSAPVARSSTQ